MASAPVSPCKEGGVVSVPVSQHEEFVASVQMKMVQLLCIAVRMKEVWPMCLSVKMKKVCPNKKGVSSMSWQSK